MSLQEPSHLHFQSAGILTPSHWAFSLGSGAWPQVLMLASWALHRLSPLPSFGKHKDEWRWKPEIRLGSQSCTALKSTSGPKSLENIPHLWVKEQLLSTSGHPTSCHLWPQGNMQLVLPISTSYTHSLTVPVKAQSGFDGSSWLEIKFWPSFFEFPNPLAQWASLVCQHETHPLPPHLGRCVQPLLHLATQASCWPKQGV